MLGEAAATTSGACGGSEDDGAAARDGGRDLVRHEVEREVERRDPEDRPRRHPHPVAGGAARRRRRVERQDLAADASRLLGGEVERRGRPRDLALGLRDRLAGLAREQLGEIAGLGRDRARHSGEDRLALVAGTPRELGKRGHGGRRRAIGARGIRLHHVPQPLAGPRVAHLERRPVREPIAGDVQRSVRDGKGHDARIVSAPRAAGPWVGPARLP